MYYEFFIIIKKYATSRHCRLVIIWVEKFMNFLDIDVENNWCSK